MTRHLLRRVHIVLALIAGATCLNACSGEYSSAPVSAQVVSAETGQPVAGVHVVAHWQLEGGLEGGTPLGAVTVLETQTDDSGRFQFPAWGPKDVPTPFWGLYANARVKNSAPQLLLFREGYEYQSLGNYGDSEPDPKRMRSDWDGKVIKLKPFHGNSRQYANALWDLSNNLNIHTAWFGPNCSAGKPCPTACQWQNIPNMLRAIGQQFRSFEADGIHNSSIYSDLISNDSRYRRFGCASPVSVLGADEKLQDASGRSLR